MEQAVSNPLGTERISKLLVRFGVPSIISLVVNSLYNMVDQIFIGKLQARVFLEIMDKNTENPYAMTLPAGTFRCRKIEMTPEMDLPATIERTYGAYQQVVVANILLDKFQLGTKKSELQMRIL